MTSLATEEIRTPGGVISYRDEGQGEPLLFVHGALAAGSLWSKVVPLLTGAHRCIVPEWPLGCHPVACPPGADLSPPGLARTIVAFCDELGLDSVTLVGNDSGGALCQLVAAGHPERVRRLVLTPCDAFENFPPKFFRWLVPVSRLPGSGCWPSRCGRRSCAGSRSPTGGS